MTEYHMGHVKREPQNGLIALRTGQPEPEEGQLPPYGAQVQTWMVMSPFSGVSFLPTSVVDAWDDIYVQDPPEEPPV
jgi:hypothetical protein